MKPEGELIATWKSLLGSLAAPALLGALINLVLGVVVLTQQPPKFGLAFGVVAALSLAIATLAIGGVLALSCFYLAGLPAHLLLEKYQIRSRLAYILAGGAVSLAVSLLILAVPRLRHLLDASPWLIFPALLAGGPVGGAGFWRGLAPAEDRP